MSADSELTRLQQLFEEVRSAEISSFPRHLEWGGVSGLFIRSVCSSIACLISSPSLILPLSSSLSLPPSLPPSLLPLSSSLPLPPPSLLLPLSLTPPSLPYSSLSLPPPSSPFPPSSPRPSVALEQNKCHARRNRTPMLKC